MKILAKLLGGFLLVALLCGTVGIFGYVELAKTTKSIEGIAYQTIPAIIQLNTIAKEFLKVKVAIRNMANPSGNTSRDFLDNQYKIVDTSRAVYKPAMEEYDQFIKTEKEAKLWKTVQDRLALGAAYTNKTIEETKKLGSLSDPAEIAAQYEVINAHVWGQEQYALDNLVVSLDELIVYVDEYYAREQTKLVTNSAQKGIVLVFSVTIAALVIAILLGLFLGNSIGKSVKKAAYILNRIAVGDISERAAFNTRDEFRQMGESLNAVCTNIENLIAECSSLSKTAVDGKLMIRGNSEKFQGGYRDIIIGTNEIIDALVGFIDSIPAPTMIIDNNYEIQFMNKAGASLGNSSSTELVHTKRKCYDFLKTSDCRTQNCACTRAMQSDSLVTSETSATPLHDTYEISYTGVPVKNRDGKTVGAFEVITDQTSIKKAERKMKKIASFQNTEIGRLNGNLQKIAKGDLSCDLVVAEADDDTRDTKVLFDTISLALEESVKAIEALVSDTNLLTDAAVSGLLQTRADEARHFGDYRKIIQGINRTLDLVIAPINETIAVFKRLSEGDLTGRVDGDYRGDFDVLKSSLNDSLEAINDTLSQINNAVDQVAEGSVQVSQASQALSQGATEQASSLEEITSSTTEISSQTRQNTENALKMNGLAREAQENAEKGNVQMKDLVSAMSDINTSAEEIKKVVKTIDDISFQINLLALNANVEAARAGKYGKGFAVVAEEVRNLAVRSANSVKDTTRMVEDAITNIQRGNTLVENTAQQLDEIVGGSSQVSSLAEEVATAGREQTQGLEQISIGLNQIDQVTQNNTASAEESASASEELSSQAQQVKSMLARFTLTDSTPTHGSAQGTRPGAARPGATRQGTARPGMTRPASTHERTSVSAPVRSLMPERENIPAQKQRAKPVRPADIISLDDSNFGKF